MRFFAENNRPGFEYPSAGSFSLIGHWLQIGMTGAIRSAALLLHRTAGMIWEGAPMEGVHRSPLETVLVVSGAAAVPGS
jgi:hypothetical protein